MGRFIDVCQAMQYAHDRGVLHRDLKPGNIMLGKYGETLVVDWGLAKATGKRSEPGASAKDNPEPTLRPASASDSAETVAGTALGTPAYMSPEQAAGRLDLLGPACDVYSLGATLYCLLTGKPSIEDRDVATALRKVCDGDFPKPRQRKPDIDRPLEAICLKAMAREAADRYVSPRALAEDVERWLADNPVTAWPEPWTKKARRWAKRHQALVTGASAALFVTLIALTVGGYWYGTQRAEALRKQSQAEDTIERALNQGRSTRDQLHKTLEKPEGVQSLLNQPTQWNAQIRSARADWQRARDLMAQLEGAGDPAWAAPVKTLDLDLFRDQADFELAMRLEKIHQESATWVKGTYNYAHAQAEKDYLVVLGDAGMKIEGGHEEANAALIKDSALKYLLLATLDHCAWLARSNNHPEVAGRMLDTARRADPHPWRVKLRDLEVWKDAKAVSKVLRDAQADPTFRAGLSPEMLAFLSELLPEDEKETWLRKGLEAYPGDHALNFRLGALLTRNDAKRMEGVGYFRAALALRPSDAAAYNNLGNTMLEVKNYDAANEAFAKAKAIDPDFAPGWWGLADVMYHKGDHDGAIDAYKKGMEKWLLNRIGLARYAAALYHRGRIPEAIDVWKTMTQIAKDDPLPWANLAIAYRVQENLKSALDAGNEAVAVGPKYAMGWNSLGQARLKLGDRLGAIEAFKKSLELDPNDADCWTNLAGALGVENDRPLAGDRPAAIEALKKALALNPKSGRVWVKLGSVLMIEGDYPRAMQAFEKVIELVPDDPYSYWALALCLRQQGRYAEAMKSLERAKQLGNRSKIYDVTIPYETTIKITTEADALNIRIPGVLQEPSADELVKMAKVCVDMDCKVTKKRYREAAELLGKAFAMDAKTAEDLERNLRFNAGCYATLAAAGKGREAEKLDDKARARLRQRAVEFLQADLATRAKRLDKGDPQGVLYAGATKAWLHTADLASLRDEKEIAKLPSDESAAVKKLWADVESLAKKASTRFTESEHKGQLKRKEHQQRYPIKMIAGRTYVIDLESTKFDAMLLLEDEKSKKVAENDDISPVNQNSRIVFVAPADGLYRIVATSYRQGDEGDYVLTIREFTPPTKAPK